MNAEIKDIHHMFPSYNEGVLSENAKMVRLTFKVPRWEKPTVSMNDLQRAIDISMWNDSVRVAYPLDAQSCLYTYELRTTRDQAYKFAITFTIAEIDHDSNVRIGKIDTLVNNRWVTFWHAYWWDDRDYILPETQTQMPLSLI